MAAALWDSENVSYVSHADDSSKCHSFQLSACARTMRPATSPVLLWPVGRSRFYDRVYLHLSLTVPSTVSHRLTPHAIFSRASRSLLLPLSEGQRYSHISRSPWQRCSKKGREAAKGRRRGEQTRLAGDV